MEAVLFSRSIETMMRLSVRETSFPAGASLPISSTLVTLEGTSKVATGVGMAVDSTTRSGSGMRKVGRGLLICGRLVGVAEGTGVAVGTGVLLGMGVLVAPGTGVLVTVGTGVKVVGRSVAVAVGVVVTTWATAVGAKVGWLAPAGLLQATPTSTNQTSSTPPPHRIAGKRRANFNIESSGAASSTMFRQTDIGSD